MLKFKELFSLNQYIVKPIILFVTLSLLSLLSLLRNAVIDHELPGKDNYLSIPFKSQMGAIAFIFLQIYIPQHAGFEIGKSHRPDRNI